MNVVELVDKTKQVDAILYNLLCEYYFEDEMDAEAKSQFERWWDLKCIDLFNNTSLQAKKEIYEKG